MPVAPAGASGDVCFMDNKQNKSTLSLLSMIFGIIGLLTTCMCIGIVPCIIGIVLSIIALKNKSGSRKKALVGLITSSIGIIFFIAILFSLGNTEDSSQIPSDQKAEVVDESVSNSESTQESLEATKESLESTVAESKSDAVAVTEPVVSDMEIHFIDVGQGDATLIKSDGHYMLIDAGDSGKGTTVQLYLQKQGVEKLDYLVLTHPDIDHIGGADVIVTKFDVDTVFLGDFREEHAAYEELMNALEYKQLKYSTPKVGSEYKLGNSSFTIVAPNSTYDDSNNSSIALVIENGDNTFLFTGDCEKQAESDILSNGLKIDCDVYKLGHHGSSSASSQEFLDAVTPTYAVISCAKGNPYGHPHAGPLNALRTMGTQVFRTDEQENIIAYSNGSEITWSCSPSDTWQTGETTVPTTPSSSAPHSTAEPTVEPTAEPAPEPSSESQEPKEEKGVYAVNGKNGKIHLVGECFATDSSNKHAMDFPVYFNTYEEAEAYSISIAPDLKKRRCGNCW